MNSRPKQPKYARNKNILVIGGSGSGKTRFFVKPNLMQMHSSYVVTDPKGTVLVECGKMLEKGGYVIKSLNTINFRKSMHYNPFAYIRSEKDILKLVNTIILNTKGDGDKSGEDFWVKAEKLYYTALIGYIWYEAPDHEKNFTTLLEMINASEAREDDETFKNPVDVMFDELEARDPDHFAVKQYRKYKLAAGAAGPDGFLQRGGSRRRSPPLHPRHHPPDRGSCQGRRHPGALCGHKARGGRPAHRGGPEARPERKRDDRAHHRPDGAGAGSGPRRRHRGYAVPLHPPAGGADRREAPPEQGAAPLGPDRPVPHGPLYRHPGLCGHHGAGVLPHLRRHRSGAPEPAGSGH